MPELKPREPPRLAALLGAACLTALAGCGDGGPAPAPSPPAKAPLADAAPEAAPPVPPRPSERAAAGSPPLVIATPVPPRPPPAALPAFVGRWGASDLACTTVGQPGRLLITGAHYGSFCTYAAVGAGPAAWTLTVACPDAAERQVAVMLDGPDLLVSDRADTPAQRLRRCPGKIFDMEWMENFD